MVNKIFVIILTIFGFKFNQPKYDLHRKNTREQYLRNLDLWVSMNFGIISLVVLVGLVFFFVWFCFFITGVSAVESGGLRNFVNGGMV